MDDLGGWVIDHQSLNQMGSPYIMAHGLGEPVADAVKSVMVSCEGNYRLWVRTRDWTRPWSADSPAGRFQVLVNGHPSETVFGTENASWSWQDGGIVSLNKGNNTIALHDLTGFNGRCDALYLTSDLGSTPPSSALRNRSHKAKNEGKYDLVVVGGGIAGCCAAVSAA